MRVSAMLRAPDMWDTGPYEGLYPFRGGPVLVVMLPVFVAGLGDGAGLSLRSESAADLNRDICDRRLLDPYAGGSWSTMKRQAFLPSSRLRCGSLSQS
jgi:hypothetical protein